MYVRYVFMALAMSRALPSNPMASYVRRATVLKHHCVDDVYMCICIYTHTHTHIYTHIDAVQ